MPLLVPFSYAMAISDAVCLSVVLLRFSLSAEYCVYLFVFSVLVLIEKLEGTICMEPADGDAAE